VGLSAEQLIQEYGISGGTTTPEIDGYVGGDPVSAAAKTATKAAGRTVSSQEAIDELEDDGFTTAEARNLAKKLATATPAQATQILQNALGNLKAGGLIQSAAGGIANAVNAVGNAGSAAGNFLGDLGNLSLWKGLGLVIAGLVILVFVGIELLKVAG
jgi:hypothetical protein